MLKPNANFKLSKTAKRLMASSADRHQSNQIKKMMIEAELSAAIMPRISKGKRDAQGK
jgi:hypothetical protein